MVLKKLWEKWQRFGKWMGNYVTRAILFVFYFSIALPFGLLVRLFQDPLDMRDKASAGWVKRDKNEGTIAEAQKVY